MKPSWLYSLNSVYSVERLTSQSPSILKINFNFSIFYVNSNHVVFPNGQKIIAMYITLFIIPTPISNTAFDKFIKHLGILRSQST